MLKDIGIRVITRNGLYKASINTKSWLGLHTYIHSAAEVMYNYVIGELEVL